MRIALGILALILVLAFLDAPITRGMKEQVIAWVTEWTSKSTAQDTAESVLGSSAKEAAEGSLADCSQEKRCDIRHRHSCGPVRLEFSAASAGPSRCERVTMILPPAEVVPLLRRARCFLLGEDTRVRFQSENYQPRQGPRDGDTIEVRDGSSDVIVSGNYERGGQTAWVAFENIGPGGSVVLKCEAFGPS